MGISLHLPVHLFDICLAFAKAQKILQRPGESPFQNGQK
jgi:hypothetical protein